MSSYFSVLSPCLFKELALYFSYKDLKDKLGSFDSLIKHGSIEYLDSYFKRNISSLSVEFIDIYINSSTRAHLQHRLGLAKTWLYLSEIDPPLSSPQTRRTQKMLCNLLEHHKDDIVPIRNLIEEKRYGLAILLIELGVKTKNTFTPNYLLERAIFHDQYLLTTYLFDCGENNFTGNNPLIVPIVRRNYLLIEFLLQRNFDFNKPLVFGRVSPFEEVNKIPIPQQKTEPLVYAIEKRDILLIDLLLKYKVNVNIAFNTVRAPIAVAVNMNDVAIARLLISHGADLNFKCYSLLNVATKGNQNEMAKVLIHGGARVEMSSRGHHPTDLAIDNKNLELFYLFSPISRTTSSLSYAAKVGSIEMIQHLLGLGMNPDQQEKDGCTPLMIAAKYDRIDICEFLLTLGVDVNRKNLERQSALYFAIKRGSTPITKLLLDNGADAKGVEENDTQTYLHLLKNDPEMIELLFGGGYIDKKFLLSALEILSPIRPCGYNWISNWRPISIFYRS